MSGMRTQTACVGMVYISRAQSKLVGPKESPPKTKIHIYIMKLYISHQFVLIRKSTKTLEKGW